MSPKSEKLKRIDKELKSIGIFTSEQNKQIQALKSEINMLADICNKESEEFKKQFGNEWKNLASVQHTLKVVNTSLYLLSKRAELSETYISDIYERVTKMSDLMSATLPMKEPN